MCGGAAPAPPSASPPCPAVEPHSRPSARQSGRQRDERSGEGSGAPREKRAPLAGSDGGTERSGTEGNGAEPSLCAWRGHGGPAAGAAGARAAAAAVPGKERRLPCPCPRVAGGVPGGSRADEHFPSREELGSSLGSGVVGRDRSSLPSSGAVGSSLGPIVVKVSASPGSSGGLRAAAGKWRGAAGPPFSTGTPSSSPPPHRPRHTGEGWLAAARRLCQ